MLISKNLLLKIKSNLDAEHILNGLLGLIVLIIILLSSIALYTPISHQQFQNVQRLSGQQSLPATQHMAIQLMHAETISSAHYLRLMHAHDHESSKIRQYPAMAIEDE